LFLDEFEQIVDVEHIAHLLARAAVSDVGELAPEVVREHPVSETPWSTLPICYGPAMTPQRLMTVGRP
jgi:hypothetical protein